MHPLDSVEERLRCTFPPSFRETYAKKNVLTGIERWEVSTPDQMMRTLPNHEEGGFPDSDGLAIGWDIGGNRLLLRFAPDQRTLFETLWSWDHETREVREEAKDLAALFFSDEETQDIASAAFSKDPITKGADNREEYWDRAVKKEDLDVGGVCKFCGSGLADDSVCSVCNRHVDEPSDPKSKEITAAYAQATRIVRLLVEDGRLELTSTSARTLTTVIELTARVIEEVGDVEASVVSDALFARWENQPEVAEVFIDEFDLTALVYATRANI